MVSKVEAPWVEDSVRGGGAQRSVGGHTPREGGGVEAVQLCWVPSHFRVPGNQQVDSLAEKGR